MTGKSILPREGVLRMIARASFWQAVWERDTVKRACGVAAVVGTVLILINQRDVILSGALPPLWKLVLTYCVPYGVSTYAAAAFKVTYRGRQTGLESGARS